MARKSTDKPAKASEKDLLVRVRQRYKVMVDADDENRRNALDDLKFLHVPGEQWDPAMKRRRGKRPCYEFNKLRITAKRVINDMRANRPAGKVRGTEDGDKDTADVYEGLIRNIWATSDGDTIIDYAAEYQVGAGMGAWRIEKKYSSDTSFEQDIVVSPIKNPFCLYADPSCADPLKRDADDWILTERISKAAFERRWPKADVVEFEADGEFDDEDDWEDENTVRICEYWYRKPVMRRILLLSDGRSIDAKQADQITEGVTIVREREVRTTQICMCIVSGSAVLEGPVEWDGPDFPFVIVYGDWVVVDGKTHWWGLTRHAKDAQRSYNVSRTAVTETIAAAPQAKFWATPKQAEGHIDKWSVAHDQNIPALLYNPDLQAAGPPQRMGGADVPVALIQESQIASEEIKAVTGIFDASLGVKSNEQSGRAINARQRQGEIATFNFADNMAKGIRRTWEILIGLIPTVYTSERSIRILGVDGAEKYVRINSVQQDPRSLEMLPVNDLSRGRYDVTVTVGPNYATQRQEASETFTQLAQAYPPLMQIAGDLVLKNLDVPGAEQLAERIKFMLPPQILQAQQQDGQNDPQLALAQAFQLMQQAQQQTQVVQQAAQQLQGEQSEAEKAKAQVETAIANLKTERAQFDAYVAQEMLKIQSKDLQLRASQIDGERQATSGDRESLIGEVAQSLDAIAMQSQQLAQMQAEQIAELQAQTAQTLLALQQRAMPEATRKVVRVSRQNGALVGEMVEVPEDGGPARRKSVRVSRQNGAYVGEMTDSGSIQ